MTRVFVYVRTASIGAVYAIAILCVRVTSEFYTLAQLRYTIQNSSDNLPSYVLQTVIIFTGPLLSVGGERMGT